MNTGQIQNLRNPMGMVNSKISKEFIKLCIDFIPIILVYLFLSNTRQFIVISGTTLGKFIAICMILFYTFVNPMYGVFVCLSIILYYQTDFVEEILNMERGEWMESELMKMNQLIHTDGVSNLVDATDSIHSYEFASIHASDLLHDSHLSKGGADSSNSSESTIFAKGASGKKDDISFENRMKMKEGFSANDPSIYSYVPVRSYRNIAEDLLDKKDRKSELMQLFRTENCKNGVLLHREMEVHPEMSDHIFREIKFDDTFRKCNPCDPTCAFSIIEEKINTESRLLTPVRSNDMMEVYSDAIRDAFTKTTTLLYGYAPNLPNWMTPDEV